jgi:hypothetical protein
MPKLSKEDQIKANCLSSDLQNMLYECCKEESGLQESLILSYFSDLMESAKVNTDVTIAVLEQFGEDGKNEARNLKIKWGY